MKMNHSKILYNSRSWEFRAKDISSCRLMRRSSWYPDIQAAVTMHKRPILAISSFSSHPLHSERGRRPRIHKGSENSFLNNSACSSLKMATKSVAKAAMKKDWKDKARDRVGAVSLSADTPSLYNSLQIMLPFFFFTFFEALWRAVKNLYSASSRFRPLGEIPAEATKNSIFFHP